MSQRSSGQEGDTPPSRPDPGPIFGANSGPVQLCCISCCCFAGHLFNHRLGGATFDLVPLPAADLPPALARFLPAAQAAGADPGLRWVPLVLARDTVAAEQGQPVELWVDYGVDANSLGYHV